MRIDPRQPVSDLEKALQERFDKTGTERFTSTAVEAASSDYVKDLVLPEEDRGMMPLTKEELVLSENPLRVEWEREVRKFLKRLSTRTSHRITAVMVYEWATGIKVKDLLEADKQARKDLIDAGGQQYTRKTNAGNLNMHLRHINWVLREYFGQPRKTKIAGRDVGRAYKVRHEFRVELKKPANITLWPDWDAGTLRP